MSQVDHECFPADVWKEKNCWVWCHFYYSWFGGCGVQGFNWESHKQQSWWNRLKDKVSELSAWGFTSMWLPPAFDSLAPQGFCLTPNLQLFANFCVTHHGCLHTILDHSFPHALLSRSQSSSAYGDALADFILVSCTKRKILRRPQILGGGPTVMALVAANQQ